MPWSKPTRLGTIHFIGLDSEDGYSVIYAGKTVLRDIGSRLRTAALGCGLNPSLQRRRAEVDTGLRNTMAGDNFNLRRATP
ncbi:hypothetical protein OH687_21910 [Burkholderia anthina]|nr:hypothetical protein OH687_21910 [Burkholderia anthina]